MVAQKYKDMLQKKSVIRTLSEFATKRGQEIGYENVFDYSLGNPSVPVVQDYTDNTIRLLQTKTSSELHGYSPSVGLPSFKEKVAASLNKRLLVELTLIQVAQLTIEGDDVGGGRGPKQAIKPIFTQSCLKKRFPNHNGCPTGKQTY